MTPRRPADLGDESLADLVAAYTRHQQALTDATLGLGPPKTPADLAGHAIGALCTAHAIAGRALWPRWYYAVDALTYGAPLDHVCAAMDGLDLAEFTVGLRSWVDGQLKAGRITDADADEILALLEVTR